MILCLISSVRIDPHIDGPNNSVIEQHVETSPYPTGHPRNWAGNAYIAPQHTFETTGDGVRDADPESERGWIIVNENKKHYANNAPVGYKMILPSQPRMLAKKDSLVATRAPFAKHALWTVPYEEDRVYAAGKYVVQTNKTPPDTVEAWVGDGTESIRNKDIVVFITTGITHLPRAEEYVLLHASRALSCRNVSLCARCCAHHACMHWLYHSPRRRSKFGLLMCGA